MRKVKRIVAGLGLVVVLGSITPIPAAASPKTPAGIMAFATHALAQVPLPPDANSIPAAQSSIPRGDVTDRSFGGFRWPSQVRVHAFYKDRLGVHAVATYLLHHRMYELSAAGPETTPGLLHPIVAVWASFPKPSPTQKFQAVWVHYSLAPGTHGSGSQFRVDMWVAPTPPHPADERVAASGPVDVGYTRRAMTFTTTVRVSGRCEC